LDSFRKPLALCQAWATIAVTKAKEKLSLISSDKLLLFLLRVITIKSFLSKKGSTAYRLTWGLRKLRKALNVPIYSLKVSSILR
jgi:hypothetical protein